MFIGLNSIQVIPKVDGYVYNSSTPVYSPLLLEKVPDLITLCDVKSLITIIAAVVLVGCGGSIHDAAHTGNIEAVKNTWLQVRI